MILLLWAHLPRKLSGRTRDFLIMKWTPHLFGFVHSPLIDSGSSKKNHKFDYSPFK